jgi:eukaryotic-like serine/threonine-protein kinase
VRAKIPAGTVIGGEYVVEQLLGEGGMGSVYLARQRSTFRLRALKILTERVITNKRDRERFEREAMIGSIIESEHVVEVIGAGVDETPQGPVPWLAMEYLEGQELLTHVAGQPGNCLPRGHAIVVLEQVFHAIEAAHRASVVHRDIKAENVFLATAKRVGAPFVVKVLDFGMAKISPERPTGSRTVTMGTPGWLAPEQLDEGRSSAASDVWALGLLTFFVLTGRLFWLGQHNDAEVFQLISESALSPIPKASERAMHFGRAELLPAGFDDWFARCVVHDPAQRFQNAQDAWSALAPLLNLQAAPEPIVSTPPPRMSGGPAAHQRETALAPIDPPAQAAIPSESQQLTEPIDQRPAAATSVQTLVRQPEAGFAPIAALAQTAMLSESGRVTEPIHQVPRAPTAPFPLRRAISESEQPTVPIHRPPIAIALNAMGGGDGGGLGAELEQQRAAARKGVQVPAHPQDPDPVHPARDERSRRSAKRLALLVSAGAGIVMAAGIGLAVVRMHGPAPASPRPGPKSSVFLGPTSAAASAPAASASPAVPDMVALPAGSFRLDGATAHVEPFEMDRTEVTVQQWEKCVSAGACSADVAAVNVKGAQAWSLLCNWPRRNERGDHPINCVSHDQAQAMCRWAQKRLPSEIEWYYAAYVAGGERTYPWTAGAAESGSVNLCGTECASMLRSSGLVKNKEPLEASYADPFAETGPVSALAGDSTPSGLIGMGGNVAEWTATTYDDKRVRCRGGSWLTSNPNDAARSAVFALQPDEHRVNVGFRCAK